MVARSKSTKRKSAKAVVAVVVEAAAVAVVATVAAAVVAAVVVVAAAAVAGSRTVRWHTKARSPKERAFRLLSFLSLWSFVFRVAYALAM